MKRFKLKRGLCGLGLFAEKPFKRWEVVIEYTGEVIDDAEADRRANRYIYEVRKNVNIDASDRRNLARYVNHGCDPNCYERNVGGRIFYAAKRNIARGEELTIDYGPDYFKYWIAPHGCRCDAKTHRRTRKKKMR